MENRMKVNHDLEFTGACIQENISVKTEQLVHWLMWCVSVAK